MITMTSPFRHFHPDSASETVQIARLSIDPQSPVAKPVSQTAFNEHFSLKISKQREFLSVCHHDETMIIVIPYRRIAVGAGRTENLWKTGESYTGTSDWVSGIGSTGYQA